MKKIIIIDHEPLTIRRRQIFYIEELRERGFDVEFWDCSQYFHPGIVLQDNLNEDYLRKFNSLSAIKKALLEETIKETVFVVEAFDMWKNRKFFKLMAQNNCFTIRQEMYATAVINKRCKSLTQKLINAGKCFLANPIKYSTAQLYKIYKHHYHIAYRALISSSCDANVTLHINHIDWEIANSIKQEPAIEKNRYAVFLDEYFTLHPDMLFFGNEKQGNTEKYHKVMTKFFDEVEKQHNVKVIIAAHPKSAYENGEFGGRQIIKYQSARLIKDAQMVFVHSSAAIAFAIIFDKPTYLIYTEDYKKNKPAFKHLKLVAKTLGINVHNIEKNTSLATQHFNSQLREDYIYRFLTSRGIENKSNKDLLISYFSSL